MKYSWCLFVDTHGAKSKLVHESNDKKNDEKFKQFYYQADTHYTKDEIKLQQELLKNQILISRNGEVDAIPNQTVVSINRVLQFLAVKDPKSSMKERNNKAMKFVKLSDIPSLQIDDIS